MRGAALGRRVLGAVHLSDSNRHQPGTGHVPFGAIVATLREIGLRWRAVRRVPAARRPGRGRARVRALPARTGRWRCRLTTPSASTPACSASSSASTSVGRSRGGRTRRSRSGSARSPATSTARQAPLVAHRRRHLRHVHVPARARGLRRRTSRRPQIGQTWLNYVIEERTTLWWGGVGVSTEHTAYLRLRGRAPAAGSTLTARCCPSRSARQIFIDGWAMACPGDPERAATWPAARPR